MDNSGLTLVLAQPDNSSSAPETAFASELNDTMRPFQPIVSNVGQQAEGPEDAPHRGAMSASKQRGPKMLHIVADRSASNRSFVVWCFFANGAVLRNCVCVVSS